MFEMTLADIVWLTQEGAALNPRIKAVVKAKGLPVKIAYHFGKIQDRLERELKHYSEHRLALVKEHGEEAMVKEEGKPDRPSGSWSVPPEKAEAFFKAHGELLDTKFSINLNTVTIAQLGDKVDGLTGDDLAACLAFIVDTPEASAGGALSPAP